MRKALVGLPLVALCAALLPASSVAATHVAGNPAFGSGPVVQARASEPVVITGAQIPSWSRLAATGISAPYPSGVTSTISFSGRGGDNVRSAHNGFVTLPPDTRIGVEPDQIAAYRWDGSNWSEIPVQVDQMFPYFLANGHSSFSVYSGTDKELTYAWNATGHSIGEEAWKKVFGGITGITAAGYSDPNPCRARYQQSGPNGAIELARAIANGVVSEPATPGIPPDDYTQAMQDPVNAAGGKAELNDDDQIAMMAGDAGLQAPSGTLQPAGSMPNNGQQITITDPTSATDGSSTLSYIYLFLQPGGSHFNNTNGYVQLARDNGADTGASDPNANEWIDRYSFSPTSTEKIGVSNTGYGPNIGGDVCRTVPDNDASPHITAADGTPRPSTDRQPRDGMTITTPTYRVYASGRWMVRQVNIKPAAGAPGTYGPNLISRWKGRAFQSSPDSSVSVVGFEDEQVNWELNNALLGWKVGPVRAIREVWGADSGTNVTKTEFYYRDGYDFSYHVRVHPIPPDGLYTAWDYNYGAVSTYYNQKSQLGLPIDGRNVNSFGQVDQIPPSGTIPAPGTPAYFNACNAMTDVCTAILNPEEVSGNNGSLVYIADLTGPSSAFHPAVVPFYRDDACFDDGTGDGPVPRPYPGDPSTDANVKQGYVNYWQSKGAPVATYADLKCQPLQPTDPGYQTAAGVAYNTTAFQGAIGEMGLHFFFSGDSDNLFVGDCIQGVTFNGLPLSDVCFDEIDAEQWVYTVPTATAANLISPASSAPGQNYGANVVAPLLLVATPFSASVFPAAVPESPLVFLLPLGAIALSVPLLRSRRRRS